jgi:hypothetical protein
MQHVPKLSETVDNLLKGRLRETNYPFVDGAGVGPNASLQKYGIGLELHFYIANHDT